MFSHIFTLLPYCLLKCACILSTALIIHLWKPRLGLMPLADSKQRSLFQSTKRSWFASTFPLHIAQDQRRALGTAWGLVAELKHTPVHFSPQIHHDNPETTAMACSTIHHCQAGGHSPLVRNHSRPDQYSLTRTTQAAG